MNEDIRAVLMLFACCCSRHHASNLS